MKGKIFLDSNIIVYLYDLRYPRKKEIAEKLIESIPRDKLVISTQVLKEVSNVLIRKVGYPLKDWQQAISFYKNYEIVDTPLPLIQKALDLMQSESISFWHSLIVAAAHHTRCQSIYTEDLSHGQKILGMEIHNPFA